MYQSQPILIYRFIYLSLFLMYQYIYLSQPILLNLSTYISQPILPNLSMYLFHPILIYQLDSLLLPHDG